MQVSKIAASSRGPLPLVGLLALASALFSLALACAVPLAAFAALAALYLRRRDALALVAATWLVNQAIGFGFQDYPRDALTFAWGVALLASAVVAMVIAGVVAARGAGMAWLVAVFAAAFVGYEGTLYLAHFVLGGGSEAYAPAVVFEILWTNALAFAGLFAIHVAATRFHLAPATRPGLVPARG